MDELKGEIQQLQELNESLQEEKQSTVGIRIDWQYGLHVSALR